MSAKIKNIFIVLGLFCLSLGLAGCGGGGGSAVSPSPAAIKVSISPGTASVNADGTQQFTATVSNTTNTKVTWSVGGSEGGNSTVGTISAQGLYTAPDPLPDPASVTVTAASQADTTKSASANVSLTYAAPSVSSISPNYVLVNSSDTTLTIAGSGFSKASTVSLGSTSLTATFISSTQITAVLPAADASAEGKFSLAVANPSPGGGTSGAQEFDVYGTALTVNIIDLPEGTPASVTVTGPDNVSQMLTASQTIVGAEGTYSVTAAGVAVGGSTYFATKPAQTVSLAAGNSSTLVVDYYDIVPDTTKVLDSAGTQNLTISPDGTTLTISSSSEVAQALKAGDVLVSGPGPGAPHGILCKVLSVSQSGSYVVVAIGPATLKDAFSRVRIDFSPTLSPASQTSTSKTLEKSTTLTPSTATTNNSLSNPCASDPSTFAVPFNQEIVADPSVNSSITASGELDVCGVQPHFSLDSNASTASFTVTLNEYANVVVEGHYTLGSFDKTLDLPPLLIDDIVFFVGPVPVVITPELTPYVGANGDVSVSFATGASQSGKAEGGISYQNGQVSAIKSVNLQAAADPISADAGLDAKGFAGAKFELAFWGSIVPNLDLDGYLDFNADTASTPWWTLTGGLEADGGVDVSLLGFFSQSFDLGETTLWSTTIAQASSPFSALPTINSLTPNAATVGSPDLTLALTGSNFVPGCWVSFNGMQLPTTFVDADDLKGSLPGGLLGLDGAFPVTVTNPDTSGAISSPVTFTVTGTLVSVLPSAAQVPATGVQQFAAEVLGPSNTAVTWGVNGVAGGSSTVGTINAAGLYTAPSTVPNPPTVSVLATSQAVPSASGSATVTIGPYTEQPVYSFTSLTDGAAPSQPLVLASDGNYYGTAQLGGANGYGTVFKVDSSGAVTLLHDFTGTDGANPLGVLVEGSDGYSYGTTNWGGTYNEGTIFKMDSSGNLSTLYSFTGGSDGGDVEAGLTLGTDGYFYGVTFQGGAYGAGTVFRVDSLGNLNTLYSFTGGTDGFGPGSSLIQAADGNFYGTTEAGGNLSCEIWPIAGCGTIFKVDATGHLSTLYSFTGGTDGANPSEALMQAADGEFYGTTLFGGDPSCSVSGYTGCGTIFKITSAGSFKLIHEFSGGTEGGVPFSSLIQAGDGDFYGTATAGGDLSCAVYASGENYPTYTGCGTVFKMDSVGNVTALYSFKGSPNDGSNPFATLIEGPDGFLYGTTRWGGADTSCPYTTNGGCGTIFKVSGPGGPLPLLQTVQTNASVTRTLNPTPLTKQTLLAPTIQKGRTTPRVPSTKGVPQPAMPK